MNKDNTILKIIQEIKNGELGIIKGARQLNEFRDYFIGEEKTKINYNDLSLLFNIEFETKDLPIDEEQRKKWGAEALKTKDTEIIEIEKKYKEQVQILCDKIIEKI